MIGLSGAEPILLTPGPLTTTLATKTAMLTDWGSWDSSFNALTASVCRDLLAIAGGQASHVCVPLQGSGTFAVEAAIANLLPKTGKLLVLVNGAYGKRMAQITQYLGRAVPACTKPPMTPRRRPTPWPGCWKKIRPSAMSG